MSILARLFSASSQRTTALDSGKTADASIRNRYLKLLIDSLLNEIYLESEVRLLYVFSSIYEGKPVDPDVVRQVGLRLPETVERVRAARQDGSIWWRVDIERDGEKKVVDFRNLCQFAHTMVGRKRLENIVHCLDAIRIDAIDGDLAETGAWRGGACILMRGYLAAWEIPDKVVWVADSFEGLPKPTLPEDSGYDFSAERVPILAVTLDEVEENFRRYGLLDDQVQFLKGWFRDTLPTAPIEKLALLRLDGDLYESTMDALGALYDKVVVGGYVIVDDYGDFEPCQRAIDDFRNREGIAETLETIDWSGRYWRKTA
ncbi:MAG: TylF/MycF/NovP-related O-methyltransferase [Casimicrobiaceae bacterium]